MHGIRKFVTFNIVNEVLFSVELGQGRKFKALYCSKENRKVTKQLIFVVRKNSILAALIAYNDKV